MRKYFVAELVENKNRFDFSHIALTAKQALSAMSCSPETVSVFIGADYVELVKDAELENVKMSFEDLIFIIKSEGACPCKTKITDCNKCEYHNLNENDGCSQKSLYKWAMKTLKERHHA